MKAQIWIGCDCPNGETWQIKIAKLIDTVHDVVMDEPFCSICGKFVTTEKRNKDGDPMDS